MIAAGTAAAALVGFGFGVIGLAVPRPSTELLALVTLVAVGLDLAGRFIPRLRPPAVGRQVPIEWGRMFDPAVVALLYGARLGIGPLTILSTWLWWSTMLGAAAVGVGTSVTVAAVFGSFRLASTVAASLRAEGHDHASWFGSLRARTSRAWLALDAGAVIVGVAVIATGAMGR